MRHANYIAVSTFKLIIIPLATQHGHVLHHHAGALDTSGKDYGPDAVMKAVFAIMLHLLSDENNQVNGFIWFSDMSNFSLKHQTFWGYDVMVNSTKCFEVGSMKGKGERKGWEN